MSPLMPCSRQILAAVIAALTAAGCLPARPAAVRSKLPERRIHTYSIVARDGRSGELGVAVQSHWFQVGARVPWAEAGVGAIATQALTNASYGPRGLALLRRGKSAAQVVAALTRADPHREQRQLAVVDRHGRVAAWTGKRCIRAAGHHKGDGFSVQANLMGSAKVWPAMAAAFRSTHGPLAERLLAALQAAQAAGGDLRGRQSAALLVVRAKATGEVYNDRLVDLRVADHQRPLAELGRLLRLHRAYEAAAAASTALQARRFDHAARLLARARRLAPGNAEIVFWHAVTLHEVGKKSEAIDLLVPIAARQRRWLDLIERLPRSGLISRTAVSQIRARLQQRASQRKGKAPR